MDLINTPVHPVLAHWPLDDGTVEQLSASIGTLGFDPDHPITLATVDGDTYLMDGRARLAALERLGIAPIEGEHVVTQAFDSQAAVASAILKRNGARRQLEKSQRAMLAAELLASDALPPAILEDLPRSPSFGRSSKTSVTEALGHWLKVSGRLIRDALQLLAFDTEHPIHRLVEKVRKGAMAIGGAMAHMRRALGERRDHYRRNLRFQPEDVEIIDAYAELLEERDSSLSAAMVEQARRELEAAGRLGGGRLNGHALGASKAVQSEESRRAPLQVPLRAPCADIPAPNRANMAREGAATTPLQVPRLAPCADVLATEASTYGLQPGAPAGTLASRHIPEITTGRQAPSARVRASSMHPPIYLFDN